MSRNFGNFPICYVFEMFPIEETFTSFDLNLFRMSENNELDLLTFTRCMKTFAVHSNGIQVGCFTHFMS